MSIYGNSIILTEKSDSVKSTINSNIDKIFGYTSKDGLYNALVKLSNMKDLLRGRSELLVLDESKTRLFIQINKDGSYKIPGGSWNKNEDHLEAAKRECREEAKFEVKDIEYAGNYISIYDHTSNRMKETIPKEYQWVGTFTELYIGVLNGYYNKPIAKEDQDDIYWKGTFVEISKIYNKLNEYHQKALDMYLN